MKRISYLIILAFVSSLILSSCGDVTFAKELKLEQQLITDYIKRNDINVIKNIHPDSVKVWGENDYVLTASGLYFHLSNPGSGTEKLEINNTVVPRYIQYTLTEVPVSTSHWSILDDFGSTLNFVYGTSSDNSCPAFQEAVSYMKYNDSEANIIVHSKIGFEDNWKPATPMRYKLRIRIKK